MKEEEKKKRAFYRRFGRDGSGIAWKTLPPPGRRYTPASPSCIVPARGRLSLMGSTLLLAGSLH